MAKTNEAASNAKPLLNVRETSTYLGISESLIWSQIKKGNLQPLRIGDRVLFSRLYLERLCAAE